MWGFRIFAAEINENDQFQVQNSQEPVITIHDVNTLSPKIIDIKYMVYGSEGHKNEANHILIMCMFFSTSGHLV